MNVKENIKTLIVNKPLKLDCGQTINEFPLAYETYGSLNKDKNNAILVFHALTGDQFVTGKNPITNKDGWWSYAVGPNKSIDTNKYFVICANVIGGCMGSFGPSHKNPKTNKSYGTDFPVITINDIVNAQVNLLDHFGIRKLFSVVGGSMDGFQIAIGILSFVFLFKVGEAFLGRMSIIFYKEIGFSKSDIAIYSKTLGWITTVIFTLLGGLFVIRSGVLKAMFLAGIIMASTNLLFSLLAWSDKSELLFAIAVIFDDIAAAFATVAFVAFISLLVDRAYTATQYALLASIGTAGRTTLASSSGALVDWLNGDWGTFFILTALMVIPSLIILWILRNKLKLYEK